MFNIDPSKVLVIAVVIIIVLGPERLPHVFRQVGGVWRSFSQFRQRMESEVRSSLPDLPSTTELATYARSPSALLDRISSTTPADERAADRLGAMGALTLIARGERPPLTTASDDSPPPVCASGADAAKTWLEVQAPFVGDATLN
jgi:Sec-independent protein translocase protein TatA